MNKAKGPIWHKKQKEKGIIPKAFVALTKTQPGTNLMPMVGYMVMEVFL